MARKKIVSKDDNDSREGTSPMPPPNSTLIDGEPPIPVAEPLSVVTQDVAYEPVQINPYNLTDLKNTLDDALKRALSRPDCYTQIYVHTDVRLALGWASILVATATGLYSWKINFDESKVAVMVGVVLYFLLSSVQMAYSYFIEGDIVFVGKRKELAKRIETSRLITESKTIKYRWLKKLASKLPDRSPKYRLTLNYTLTASGGKSLVKKTHVQEARYYTDFFDEKGFLDEAGFVAWVTALVSRVENES